MIRIENLSFSYERAKVLENVCMNFEENRIYSVMGRNGSGKTTLFRLLLGILNPEEGRISIDSKDIKSMSRRELAGCISYIPQISHQEFPFSVLDTVIMGAMRNMSILARPSRNDEKRAEEILSSFGILKLKNKKMNEISGGERQLVLLSRSMMQDSAFILLDEPASSLDYCNQEMLMKRLCKIKEKAGIIFTTHNPEHALNYSDSVVLVKDASVSSYDSVSSLLESRALENFFNQEMVIRKLEENNRYICYLR